MKFSIVTPSYNQAGFIKKTIDSVINQKGDFEIEYFIMDGGSTDDTVNILKDTAKQLNKNKRIKFYWQSKKDKGQSDAINQGLKKATGDVLAYINSDDYYEEGIFAKIAKAFENNPKQLWLTGYSHIVDENKKIIQTPITLYKNFWLSFYSYSTLLVLNYISQPSTFIRKEIYQEFGNFNESLHLCMDYNYWLSVGKKYSPIILREYISNFRIHSTSKGKTGFIKQFKEDLAVASKHTNNSILLGLHSAHNHLINTVYSVIK